MSNVASSENEELLAGENVVSMQNEDELGIEG